MITMNNMWNKLSFWIPQRSKQFYSQPSSHSSTEFEAHLLPKEIEAENQQGQPIRGRKSPNLAFAIITLFLWSFVIFYAGFIAANKRSVENGWGSFEHGFTEERVVTPGNTFELTQRVFTGGVDFIDGEEVLGPSDYVGEPSPEIDAAWDAIIGGESHYFSISQEEAIALWGSESERYRDRIRGGWTGTLDLFHCLHCLNQLRKALRRDIYPEEKYRGMIHQLHCIDHLRQVIQCQGTSVISPSEFHNRRGQYINPKQLHTCRNFEKLHQFSKERYNGTIAVPRGPRVPSHHRPDQSS